MWWYLIGSVLVVWAVWSIQRTQGLYKKYDAKLAEMKEQTKRGYYPQVEIDKIMDAEIEKFKEEHIDATMYIQMADGIKSGALDVVGAEGIVMISEQEYERLDQCDKLITSMNQAQKKKDVVS
jgi:hypothetical protein